MKKRITVVIIFIIINFAGSIIFSQDQSVLKNRDQIPERYKWNLDEIYSNTAMWEIDFNKIDKVFIPSLSAFEGKLANADSLLKCLTKSDEASRLMEKLFVYIHMKADENQADNGVAELSSRSETLSSRLSAITAFIKPELLTLPENTISNYMNNPDLQDYKHSLEVLLKLKPHTLSKPEEIILAEAGDIAGSPGDIVNKLRIADMLYPIIKDDKSNDIQLSAAMYQKILENHDRDFRKRAFEGIYSQFDRVKNTFAAILQAEVKKNIFFSTARKYPSALEASLAMEFVPRSVYDKLIRSVNNNLKYLQSYVTLRKKFMGIDKVHVYDMYMPLVENYELNIPYEDAKKMILSGLTPLGPEYLSVFAKGLENRWIDVYETQNKNTGGYNWGSYDTHPYILMNYNESVDSMLTIAHEMGHAMNAYYANGTQKYVNSEVPIFNAEVASTANEVMMLKYLIANSTNDLQKLYFINQFIEMIRGTVYTQVMYSEFEKIIHERVEGGEALSSKSLNDIWLTLMKKYFGPDFESDDLAGIWWSRVPHFYMDFYVYKYATSLAASYEMVHQITEGGDKESAQKRYIEFLKAGSSDYPIDVLKKAGVDMTSTEPVDNLLAAFGSLVNDMETILRKMGKIK